MAIPISTYKKAAEEEYEKIFQKEEADGRDMKDMELRYIKEEYDKIDSSADKLKWLWDKYDEVGYDAQNWIEDETLGIQDELTLKYGKMIYEALGEDAEYYEKVSDFSGEGVVERVRGSMDEEEALQEVVDDIIKEFEKQVEHMKERDEKEQREYEETRNIVRHMQMPGEEEQVEFTTSPSELENIPSDQNLGAASSLVKQMTKIADSLDKQGFYEEASTLDKIIRTATHKDTVYYLIEDDENWSIVPQTGFALTMEDALSLWNHSNGMYNLVERTQSKIERSERIIKPPSDAHAHSEDPPVWYEGED